MSYFVVLEEFEGPLDLLVFLVEKNEVDILNIPIIDITNQYLKYLEKMKKFNVSLASEFIVMAARLVYLKSRMLLPAGTLSEEEQQELEEDRHEIEQAIREYKKFKEIAKRLKDRAEYRKQMFARPPAAPFMIDETKELDYQENMGSDIKLFNLITAFKEVLSRQETEPIIKIIKEQFSIDAKIRELLDKFKEKDEWTLHELCMGFESKLEIVITIITILELTNLKIIKLDQLIPFGRIFISVVKEISKSQGEQLIKEFDWK